MALSRFQKIAATGAAAAIGGTAFSTSAFASTADSARVAARPAAVAAAQGHAGTAAAQAARTAVAAHAAASAPVSTLVGHGQVDGKDWSVTLEFYRTLPDGYTAPSGPDGTAHPATALLCQRMVIGGVLIDHQGGPWADCQGVQGAHDPYGSGGEGLWGLQDKGTTGTRLFVSNPDATVAYGVLTFTDGTTATGHTVTVPHTSYRAWAVAIPDGKTIDTVDAFDAHHTLLSRETYWQ